MAEPGTTPPPHTRSNSPIPVAMRSGAGVSTSSVSNASPVRALADLEGVSAPGGREP